MTYASERVKGKDLSGHRAFSQALWRVVAFRNAFLEKNENFRMSFLRDAKEVVQSFAGIDRMHPDSQAVLSLSGTEWAFSYRSLQLMRPAGSRGDQISDPTHIDGGASVLHMGFIVAGCRRMLATTHSKEVYSATFHPGDYYVTSPSTFKPGVKHDVVATALMNVPEIGEVEIALMLRSHMFKLDRSTLMRVPPRPEGLHRCLAGCWAEGFLLKYWSCPRSQMYLKCIVA